MNFPDHAISYASGDTEIRDPTIFVSWLTDDSDVIYSLKFSYNSMANSAHIWHSDQVSALAVLLAANRTPSTPDYYSDTGKYLGWKDHFST